MTTENQLPEDATVAPTEAPNIPPADETPAAPAAKKRGRPSNAEKAARAAGNATAERIESGTSETKGRTKSAAKNSKRVTASDVGALAKQLVGLHQLGAMISGIPEVIINDAEGAMLATGIVAVCEEYDLSIDGKTGAALQLLGAMAVVYAPKAFKINARMSAAKKAKQAQANGHDQSADFDLGANGNVYPATPS